MDNLTHTLVGAALAESGLKRRTALAGATLMIGANFPDIDVIAVPLGYGIEWRRGATHGFLALAILPFVLAGIMFAWDKLVRRRRDRAAAPADYRQLAILSALSILTHPTLDFMNSYGMRWLMPFVNKWFYSDGLFIIDPWVLIALVLGVFWSRRSISPRPARIALGFVAAYTAGMLILTGVGRRAVEQRHPGATYMVAPVPMVPWDRMVLVDEGSGYREGRYSPLTGLLMGDGIEKGAEDPAVTAARQVPWVQGYINWVRFPYYRVSRAGDTTFVRIVDARYGSDWASRTVRLP